MDRGNLLLMVSRSNGEIEKNVVMCWELWYIIGMGKTIEPKAALPLLFLWRVQVALQTKERRAIQCMLHIRT